MSEKKKERKKERQRKKDTERETKIKQVGGSNRLRGA